MGCTSVLDGVSVFLSLVFFVVMHLMGWDHVQPHFLDLDFYCKCISQRDTFTGANKHGLFIVMQSS